MKDIRNNKIGLTKYSWWDSDMRSLPSGKDAILENQLAAAGMHYDIAEIKHLVGMGGCAYLLFYLSQKSGKFVTVLCVPHHEIIDSWGMDYFYFEGMTQAQAMIDEEWWLIAYDACKDLIK